MYCGVLSILVSEQSCKDIRKFNNNIEKKGNINLLNKNIELFKSYCTGQHAKQKCCRRGIPTPQVLKSNCLEKKL